MERFGAALTTTTEARVPKQGPVYFPYDRATSLGDDPIYPLTRGNTDLPSNAVTSSRLLGGRSGASDQLGALEPSYGSMDRPSKYEERLQEANGVVSEQSDKDTKRTSRLSKCMGVLLLLLSFILFVIGVINVIVAATALAPAGWGCLVAEKNAYADYFGPKTASMRLLTWLFVAVGTWTAIPPFIAGLALFKSGKSSRTMENHSYNPGLPVELQNSLKSNTSAPDIYRVFAVFSMVFSLPMAFLLGILDLILSSYCFTSGQNSLKFYLPIGVMVVAVVTFVVVLVTWYKAKEASDSEYHYIGSTYTVYETYEPVLTSSKTQLEPLVAPAIIQAPSHCCNSGANNPVVIVNQPPPPPPLQPVMMVQPPQKPAIRPAPRRMPVLRRPVIRRPTRMARPFSRFMAPNQGRGLFSQPRPYSGMYLPPSNQPLPIRPPSNQAPPPIQPFPNQVSKPPKREGRRREGRIQ